MKKIVILLCLFLTLNVISALDIQMSDSFDQGETILAKIDRELSYPITKEKVSFYRGHVKIPLDFTVNEVNVAS